MGRVPSYASTIRSHRHSAIIDMARGKRGVIFRMSCLSTCSVTVQSSLLAPSVKSMGDHTRIQQFAGLVSMTEVQISKDHTPAQVGEWMRKMTWDAFLWSRDWCMGYALC